MTPNQTWNQPNDKANASGEPKDFIDFDLNYGPGKIHVSLPRSNVLGVLMPHHGGKGRVHVQPSAEDTAGVQESQIETEDEVKIEKALDNPIGKKKLEDLAKPGMKVVIMASDITRPSPTEKLLPPILKRLSQAGVEDRDITVMFGMGIHRNHTEEEKQKLVGKDIYDKVRCVDSTEGEFVPIGTTSRQTPVELAKLCTQCDLLIGTGNVEYHYFVGYTGGAKCILPGACSRKTVEANHSMQLMEGAEIGVYEKNPVRQDIEEAGKMAGLDFILNVVLDEEKNVVKAVAGDPFEAHAVARKACDDLYGVRVEKPSDIVIASAGGKPKDLNMYQAQKALNNASRAVKDGGTIILLAQCPEGLGEPTFEKYITTMGLDDIIQSIREKFVLGGHKAAAIARVLKRKDLYLVSSMEPEFVRKCKMTPFGSLDDALKTALEKHGQKATIWLMPYAGSTVPLS